MSTGPKTPAEQFAERIWEGCYHEAQGHCLDKRVACVGCIAHHAENMRGTAVTDKCSGLDKQHEINVAATQRSYQEIRRALKMGKDEGLINGAERVREERDEWERKAEYAGEQYRRRNREAQAMEATLKDIASPHAMRSWDAMQQEARAALRKLEESRTAATTEPKP